MCINQFGVVLMILRVFSLFRTIVFWAPSIIKSVSATKFLNLLFPFIRNLGSRYNHRCLYFSHLPRPELFQPLGMEEFSAWTVDAFVGVGTEVVALRLEHVCREVG